jgi:hypothetical protein
MATYHVRKDGNDGNDGLADSAAQAWLTINKAAQTMVAGDITNVHTGTYTERVTTLNEGAVGNRVTLQTHGTDVVTIDGTGIGGGNSSNGLVYISSESYWTIDGFIVQNADACRVALYGECHGVWLQNLLIQDCDVSGIHATYDWGVGNPTMITDLIIDNCETDNTNINGDQEAISLIEVVGFEIKNCHVHHTPDDANNKEGIDCKMGCNDGDIHDNEVDHCKEGIYIDPSNAASDNIHIYNNSCHDNRDSGIYLASEGTQEALTACLIENNLLYHNAVIGFQVGTTFNKTFIFINNTLYDNGPNGEVCIYDDHAYNLTCVVRNNILYSTTSNGYGVRYATYADGGVTIDHNLYYNSGGSWNASNVLGTSYITGNPLLVNVGSHDFHLSVSSPAKDAGSSTSAPVDDYEGNSRPQGAAFDIGAYEYLSTASSPYINKIFGINIIGA